MSTPAPVTGPTGLTDAFLRSVAENYLWAVEHHKRPAPTIQAQVGTASVRTVHSWIRKARDRGLLPTTTQGRVSTYPWPFGMGAACRLIARTAWPNELAENRDAWAPKIATDDEIRRDTIERARMRLEQAIRAVESEDV